MTTSPGPRPEEHIAALNDRVSCWQSCCLPRSCRKRSHVPCVASKNERRSTLHRFSRLVRFLVEGQPSPAATGRGVAVWQNGIVAAVWCRGMFGIPCGCKVSSTHFPLSRARSLHGAVNPPGAASSRRSKKRPEEETDYYQRCDDKQPLHGNL